MKKGLSLVLSLVMLLSLVVPVSAEDTYPGSGDLAGKTAAFTIPLPSRSAAAVTRSTTPPARAKTPTQRRVKTPT